MRAGSHGQQRWGGKAGDFVVPIACTKIISYLGQDQTPKEKLLGAELGGPGKQGLIPHLLKNILCKK